MGHVMRDCPSELVIKRHMVVRCAAQEAGVGRKNMIFIPVISNLIGTNFAVVVPARYIGDSTYQI